MYIDLDYITIGSNGFAQVGRPDYWEKQLVERAVLMQHMAENFPVPDDLKHLCHYKWMGFPHDFGTYHELVLCYDRYSLEEIDDESTEYEIELYKPFWAFFQACERESMETEELTDAIRIYYEEHFCQDTEPVVDQFSESSKARDNFLENLDALELNPEREELIRQIHKGLMDPATLESCKRWINQCYHRPTDEELRMCAYNEILEGYGIEAHFGEWQNGFWCDVEFTYVNLGDSYALTIVRHRDKGWLVGTVDNLVEAVCLG